MSTLPSTTPRIDLSNHLTDQSHRALMMIAYEVGIQPDDVGDSHHLCWLIEVLKHIRDTNKNFPRGKYHTIKVLEQLVGEAAKEVVKIYYGDV